MKKKHFKLHDNRQVVYRWLSSRAGSRARASWLGSARYFSEPRKEARLGSFQACEPLRAEPSRSKPEPAHEPRAFFPALVRTQECHQDICIDCVSVSWVSPWANHMSAVSMTPLTWSMPYTGPHHTTSLTFSCIS